MWPLDDRDGPCGRPRRIHVFPGEPPDYVKEDVVRAIQLLYRHCSVHGEICMSNILVVKRLRSQQQVVIAISTSTEAEEEMETDVDDSGSDSEKPGAVLIDFDWSGKDRETNYPPMWYNQVESTCSCRRWRPGSGSHRLHKEGT